MSHAKIAVSELVMGDSIMSLQTHEPRLQWSSSQSQFVTLVQPLLEIHSSWYTYNCLACVSMLELPICSIVPVGQCATGLDLCHSFTGQVALYTSPSPMCLPTGPFGRVKQKAWSVGVKGVFSLQKCDFVNLSKEKKTRQCCRRLTSYQVTQATWQGNHWKTL